MTEHKYIIKKHNFVTNLVLSEEINNLKVLASGWKNILNFDAGCSYKKKFVK